MLLLVFRHQIVSQRERTLLSLCNYQMSQVKVCKLISLSLSQQHLEQQVSTYFNILRLLTTNYYFDVVRFHV